jgi:hypothetical protein
MEKFLQIIGTDNEDIRIIKSYKEGTILDFRGNQYIADNPDDLVSCLIQLGKLPEGCYYEDLPDDNLIIKQELGDILPVKEDMRGFIFYIPTKVCNGKRSGLYLWSSIPELSPLANILEILKVVQEE